MKIDYKDVLFTSLGLLLTLGLTGWVMHFLAPPLARGFGALYALGYGIALLLVYGNVAAAYLRVLTRFYPFREGVYDFDHPQFTLWKHCILIGELAKVGLGPLNLAMTRVLYYRLLGVKIGANVALGRINITDPMLTVFEDFAAVGDGAILGAHSITSDRFALQAIRVARGGTIGAACAIAPGVVVGENAVVAALSRVNNGTKIPPGEFWDGIPAVKVRDVRPSRWKIKP
jgi:acetyltransferase-like isoleucine patch superfamily enzyme